jgi:hypothetical protein
MKYVVAAAGHECCGRSAPKECEHFYTRMNGLPEYFHSQHFMSTRLSWRACFAQPAMCCHDSIHEARLGVNEVDTEKKDGVSKKSRQDNMHLKRFLLKFMKPD